jgi:hypothetical protein
MEPTAVPVEHNPLVEGAPPIASAEATAAAQAGAQAPEENPAVPAPAEAVALQVNEGEDAGREYPSLYDSKGTTVVAVLLGVSIVAAIQYAIIRMYTTAKTEQIYLTRFVTALVGLVMGAYIADLLIAGPDTSLLTDEEHTLILGFVKDIALMIFAYYFGTKSGKSEPPEEGA